MYLSQKIELDVKNKELIRIFDESFDYSRYIYNKALDEWKIMYEMHKYDKNKPKPTHRRVRDNIRKNRQSWEMSKLNVIIETSCEDLGKAFNMFYRKVNKYPNYKSKKRDKHSFRVPRKTQYSIQVKNDKYLKIQGLDKLIKMKENLKINGKIKEVTISKSKSGRYYASFCIELDDNVYFKIDESNQSFIGIDLGIKDLAIINTDSNLFRKYNSLNKTLIPYYSRVKLYQKILSKKVKGSNNYEKTITKLNRAYDRITNIRKDYINKITTYISTNYRYITIEDLQVNNMMKNKKLSRSIAESCWYEFRRQLEYKTNLYGSTLIVADKFFASTQTCSYCGNILHGKDKLPLSKRTYNCKICGNIIDRDYNASINLKLYGMRFVGVAN